MAKHLILPKSAFKDVRSLLRLDASQLRALEELFATPECISPTSPAFVQKVSERLRLDATSAESVSLVCQFLLTVVEEGHPAAEVLDDVREFVAQNAAEEKEIVSSLDSKRKILESLLTPTLERSRALKVRSLSDLHPSADSFRTVCELRPVFDRGEDGEQIIGYVPAIVLEAWRSDEERDDRVLLHLSPGALKELGQVIKRAEEKLEAIRRKFGDELLGETAKE